MQALDVQAGAARAQSLNGLTAHVKHLLACRYTRLTPAGSSAGAKSRKRERRPDQRQSPRTTEIVTSSTR